MSRSFNPAEYEDVQSRITRFWAEYPDGRIDTTLMSLPDDFERCRFKASVYKHRDDAHPSATGWAFELAGGVGANRTSHEENGETSSIGRALANLGYSKSAADRPSRQEMEKVNRGSARVDAVERSYAQTQPATEAMSGLSGMAMPGQVQTLIGIANDLEMVLVDRVAADYNVGSPTLLTRDQAGELIVQLSKERTVHMAQLAMAREKRGVSA